MWATIPRSSTFCATIPGAANRRPRLNSLRRACPPILSAGPFGSLQRPRIPELSLPLANDSSGCGVALYGQGIGALPFAASICAIFVISSRPVCLPLAALTDIVPSVWRQRRQLTPCSKIANFVSNGGYEIAIFAKSNGRRLVCVLVCNDLPCGSERGRRLSSKAGETLRFAPAILSTASCRTH